MSSVYAAVQEQYCNDLKYVWKSKCYMKMHILQVYFEKLIKSVLRFCSSRGPKIEKEKKKCQSVVESWLTS